MRAKTELRASLKRAVVVEAELRIAQERATVAEPNLRATLERATRAKAHSVEMEKKMDAAERAMADAFIDGYQDLKGKVLATFPANDFFGFIPL